MAALAAASVALWLAGAAGADVKAGVDAWGRGEFARAVEEWRPLAIHGDADAAFNLGQAYKLGRGVPLDQAMARGWFLKAANQGHLQAADNYGLALFENGQKAEAAPWLEQSVARGEPRAELVYGTMLFNGDGVARDYPRAYALMTLASRGGMKAAADTLVQMDGYITPADRQRGTALAERYAAEATAARVAEAGGGRAVVPADATTTMPPERAGARPLPLTGDDNHYPIVHLSPSRARATTPTRPATPPAHPTPAAKTGGGWRVQLGAFRDTGNAHALWARVGGKVGGTASYVVGGGMTRLQAGPFASRAAAERACAGAGGGCVVVAP